MRFNSRIIACVPVYNEEHLLPDCLKSLSGRVDEILIIDGAYEGFDGHNTSSTDGTLRVIADFMNSTKTPTKFMKAEVWRSPIDKYRHFFEMREWRDGDWFWPFDADDRIEASEEEWEEYRTILELVPKLYPHIYMATHIYITLLNDIDRESIRRGVIRWKKGLRYERNHWTWVDADGNEIDLGEKKIINTELRVRRMEHLRSKRRMDLKSHYNEYVRPSVEEPS